MRDDVITFSDRIAEQSHPVRCIVVLDNANILDADAMEQKRRQWQRCCMYLYYLPPYSPEPNRIEILWKRATDRVVLRLFRHHARRGRLMAVPTSTVNKLPYFACMTDCKSLILAIWFTYTAYAPSPINSLFTDTESCFLAIGASCKAYLGAVAGLLAVRANTQFARHSAQKLTKWWTSDKFSGISLL